MIVTICETDTDNFSFNARNKPFEMTSAFRDAISKILSWKVYGVLYTIGIKVDNHIKGKQILLICTHF